MSIQGSLQDKETQKFVESSTRPGNAVPEVTVGSSALPLGAATEAKQDSEITELQAINSKLQNLENYTDGLEALNQSILDSVDGLESLNTSLNSTATAIANSVDNIEPLLTALGNNTDQLEGFVDGLEGLATTIDTDLKSGAQKTQIVDGDGEISGIKQLNNQVVATDYGLITNSVLHGLTTGGGGGYVDVKVNPSGALTVDASNSSGLVLAETSQTQIVQGGNTATVNSNGSLTVAGVSAVGSAPVNPPISVSGVDGGGLKRHISTDTSGNVNVNTVSNVSTTDKHASGSLVASDTTTVVGPIACNGMSSGSIQLTGTFTGSIVVEVTGLTSPSSSDWTAIRCYNESTAASQNPITTGVGLFSFNVGSATFVRARRSTAGTGTAVIELNVSSASKATKVVSPNLNDFLATVYQGGGISGGIWGVTNRTQESYQNYVNNAAYAATTNNVLIGTSETNLFLFRNPNASGKTVHIYAMAFSGPGTFRLYMLPTVTGNGTALTPVRLNAVSGAQGNVGLPTFSPTTSSAGSIFDLIVVSTQIGSYNEIDPGGIVLPANTSLLVTAQMAANNTATNCSVKWLEL